MDSKGLPSPTKDTVGITELVIDANSNFTEPLTAQRLYRWHSLLFPSGRGSYGKITVGAWRTDQGGPMQVVSGGIGQERVHFQAPPASALVNLMAEFLEWFEASDRTDPLVRAGLAHFWFVTIHPFDDGNGRIGRAIADVALARAHESPTRFYSLATQIEADRKSYYRYLEHHQAASTRDLTLWLLWFLETVADAIGNSGSSMQASVLRAAVWQDIAKVGVSDRQRKALTRFMAPGFQGHLTARKYMKMTKCSHPTAYRDIKDLLNKQVLEQNPGGSKNSSYRLADRFSA